MMKQTKSTEKETKYGFNLMYEYLESHNKYVTYLNNRNFSYYYGVRKPKADSKYSEPLPYIKYEVLKELMKDEVIRKAVWSKFYEVIRTEVFPVINDYLGKTHPEYSLQNEED